MKTKILFCLLVTLSVFSASAQSGAEWNAYKRANGINPSWTYNEWVAAGMPRGGGGGSSQPQLSPEQIAAQQAAEQAELARQQRLREAAAANQQGRDAYNKKDWESAISYFQQAVKNDPDNQQYLKNLAYAQQNVGEDAFENNDYKTAVNYFQQALANDPSSDTNNQDIRASLEHAQNGLQASQQDKTAANNIQQTVQRMAQSLSTAPTSGGLDFDGDNSGNTTNGGTELKGLDDTDASLNMATTNTGTALKGFVFTATHSNTKGAIKGEMDNIAGDTYFVKFSNSSGDTYRIHYIINDEGKTIQDENTMAVQGHSSNANGPYHCGPNATIKVIKADKI